jgi:hypothetical protein
VAVRDVSCSLQAEFTIDGSLSEQTIGQVTPRKHGASIYPGDITMPNQASPNLSNVEKPSSLDEFNTSKTGEDKKIDRAADQAAEKAGKTEKRYDQNHDIFTK